VIDPIPEHFTSIEDASDFWDEHDTGDYETFLRPLNETIELMTHKTMTNKQLFANQFIAIIDRDGYTFMHEVRCEGQIVALLPYRNLAGNQREYLARLEICPAHTPDLELCSITGGKEPNKSVAETAVQELWEEAGYQATIEELIALGKVRPSKASDTTAHLFAVDVTGKEQSTPEGDGSRFEVGSSVQWLDYEQAVQVEDSLLVTTITRLLQEIN